MDSISQKIKGGERSICPTCIHYDVCKATINQPCIECTKFFAAADVRPVVRGRWEQNEVFEAKGHVDELQSAFCSSCQRYHTTPYSYYFTQYHFCPNCGADMREE